ncbi:MAG: sigma-70 family RNA polymerase sigma factor [Planctomycetes bacterium]|nr:sigma-70 family RNA polymerase sigma factor [Planctomycetota bacterium]
MRARDVRGLEALLRVHGGRTKGLLQMAFRLQEGDHCLEDAVCDAGLQLLGRARKLDPKGNLGGYFYVTARRELIRALKRLRQWHKPLWDGAEGQLAADSATAAANDPDELAPDTGFTARVQQALARLSDRERDILSLDMANDFQLKATEIATIVGTTESTVYSLRNRIKGKLAHLSGREPSQ